MEASQSLSKSRYSQVILYRNSDRGDSSTADLASDRARRESVLAVVPSNACDGPPGNFRRDMERTCRAKLELEMERGQLWALVEGSAPSVGGRSTDATGVAAPSERR